jgi:hypothetical protein
MLSNVAVEPAYLEHVALTRVKIDYSASFILCRSQSTVCRLSQQSRNRLFFSLSRSAEYRSIVSGSSRVLPTPWNSTAPCQQKIVS